MEGENFLTEYMQKYSGDYILIGGNACVLNFENIGVNFRATVDLDIVLITESTNDQFYEHLWDYIVEHGYEGKVYRGAMQEVLPIVSSNLKTIVYQTCLLK